MHTIDTSAESFKTSPLGFLMSVIAKYQAYMQKSFDTSQDSSAQKKAEAAGDMLDNLKIELSKTNELKKEPSNEAVLMHVVENCTDDEKESLLEYVFEYLNLLDKALQNIDQNSAEGKDLINEYYDVSRLGLILNCYLGSFDNDDVFYGTLAEIAEAVQGQSDDQKIKALCEMLISKIEKADINLTFKDFLQGIYNSLSAEEKNLIYEKIIKLYSDSILNKVLTEEVEAEEISKLACAKQIQRNFEKLMLS